MEVATAPLAGESAAAARPRPARGLWATLRRIPWLAYRPLLRMRRGVECRGRIRLRGYPLVQLAPGARLVLGDDVMLNSCNLDYHINLFAPVKLIADHPGAEIVIGAGSRIHGTCIHAARSVRIGAGCLIAGNTQIMDASGHVLGFDDPARRLQEVDVPRPVVIGDHVWIGAHVIILPGVTIGDGTVVAAGSVVTRSLPARVLAGGNPARVIRDYAADADA